MKNPARKNSSRNGFTLVELIVSILILSVLIFMLIVLVSPVDQLRKLQNSQRKSDLDQVKTALDTYYNDHGCYPTSVPFGTRWVDGLNILMKKVPQDPSIYCRDDSNCYPYAYVIDEESNCPQWAVVYARLSGTSEQLTTKDSEECTYTSPSGQTRTLSGQHSYKCESCPIFQICGNSAVPALSKYNYCRLLGSVDSNTCSIITGVSAVPRSSITTTTSPFEETTTTVPTSSSSTTTTAPSSTTTTACTPCSCSSAITYWGALGEGESCQLAPAGYCTQAGHDACYCSNDCTGCPCTD